MFYINLRVHLLVCFAVGFDRYFSALRSLHVRFEFQQKTREKTQFCSLDKAPSGYL
jgi:hypothetical protein